MALSPKISACYTNSNTTLQIVDITGLYSVGNTGGWNSPNSTGAQVTSASLTITFPNSETQTIDLTAEIPASITGNFSFSEITPNYTLDGVHTFVYSITYDLGDVTGEVTVTYKVYKLFLGRVKCCIDKMWAKVPSKLCDECNIESYLSDTFFAFSLYNSLMSMGACAQITTINKLLTQIQNLCSFEECNC